jgi:hypothetical protein
MLSDDELKVRSDLGGCIGEEEGEEKFFVEEEEFVRV